MSFAIGLSLLAAAAFGSVAATPSEPSALVIRPVPEPQTIKQYVENYFADIPVMVAIAGCESKFRQFSKNGQVLRGEIVHDDLGVMQINNFFHGDRAEDLGYDLHTLDGNLEYARHLYEKEGVTPWLSSAKCWKKSINSKEVALNK